MFSSNISVFSSIRSILVAVPRHPCRVLATVGMIALAGCAAAPATAPSGPAAQASTSPQARQSLVEQRAASRWDAMVKDDLDTAYGYLSPGSKQMISLEKFKANTRRRAFRAGKVDTVTCEDDACQVRVLVTYDHPKMKGITTPLIESWIVDGGQAWLVLGTQ
jgi:hypothetical protein